MYREFKCQTAERKMRSIKDLLCAVTPKRAVVRRIVLAKD
jgi:hypothetical protein